MRAGLIADLRGAYGTIRHDVIWEKVARHKLSRLYVPASDAFSNDVDYLHTRGIEYGIWDDPGHHPGITASGFAELVSETLNTIKANSKQTAVLFDVETHDIAWINTFVDAWRKLRPARATGITFEPFQGGIEPISHLESCGITLDPQLYYGDMTEVAGDRVVIDLVAHGAHVAGIAVTYDSRNLPAGWDGIAFDVEHLP